MNNELGYFSRVAGDNLLREWLELQKLQAVKVLTSAVDPLAIARAQAEYKFAERQQVLLEKAKRP